MRRSVPQFCHSIISSASGLDDIQDTFHLLWPYLEINLNPPSSADLFTSLQELEKGMENMLNAYDGPSSSPQDEMEAEEEKAADSKKKKAAAPKAQASRATGKRTRASQRKQGDLHGWLTADSLCYLQVRLQFAPFDQKEHSTLLPQGPPKFQEGCPVLGGQSKRRPVAAFREAEGS